MLRSTTKSYGELRQYLNTIPVINTHEHYTGITGPADDALSLLLGYYTFDLISAAFGSEAKLQSSLHDTTLSFDERYELFEHYYHKSNKTAYARAFQVGLKECWGIGQINKQSLLELQEKMKSRNQSFYEEKMEQCGIKLNIVDVCIVDQFKDIIEGRNKQFTKYCKFAFTLPDFHDIHHSRQIYIVQEYVDRKITCLDDYLEGFENMLIRALDFGIVCFKDQSAYRRAIDYGNPAKSEAEHVFNRVIGNPRNTFSTAEVKPLDDWLFHYFMRLAGKHRLPVQLHTGHLARNYNDIRNANASHLIPLLELHTEVKFDLFHGNWPYMDEYLFIGKNYPNAYLDLCWAHIIDPIYCVELMKRAVVAVPHSKLMVYGGDAFAIELTVGYLFAARDNTACALSELVESGWLDIREAKQIAADWFFNNPNEFFHFGFDRFTVT